ncbi:MAG TPA: HEAT repeat domain-containing protein [Bacteroidetes bacterium]|nr:HEAT repeat domain-containing protein [Bacteroidota bacterium]
MKLSVNLTVSMFLFSLAIQTLAQPTIPREQIPPDSMQKVVAEIKRLYSSDPMERGQAASSLGSMGDTAQAAIPYLMAMFHNDSVGLAYPNPFGGMPDWSDCPAKRAALALAHVGGAAVDTLLSLYNTGDEHEKLWSVYALAQIREARTTIALKQFLESSYQFYEPHYGWMGYYEEKPPIFKISYSMVLREVIEELGERRDTSAVYLLINIACDTASSLREESVQALGKIGDRRAVEPLIHLLDQNSLSGYAALALALINDPRAVKPLLSHLKDATGNYNCSVMGALGDFKSTEALNAIIPALQSPNISDRLAAADAIGANGSWPTVNRSIKERRPIAAGRTVAVEPLIDALQDTCPEVRHAVMRALGSIGDTRAIMPLYNVMKRQPAPDSWWAQDALIDITGEDFRQYDGGHDKWIQWQRKWIPGFPD